MTSFDRHAPPRPFPRNTCPAYFISHHWKRKISIFVDRDRSANEISTEKDPCPPLSSDEKKKNIIFPNSTRYGNIDPLENERANPFEGTRRGGAGDGINSEKIMLDCPSIHLPRNFISRRRKKRDEEFYVGHLKMRSCTTLALFYRSQCAMHILPFVPSSHLFSPDKHLYLFFASEGMNILWHTKRVTCYFKKERQKKKKKKNAIAEHKLFFLGKILTQYRYL